MLRLAKEDNELVLNQIQKRIKLKGLRQASICSCLNIKQSALSSLLSGNSKMSFEQFLSLCEVLEIEPYRLIMESFSSFKKDGTLSKEKSKILYKSEFHLLFYCEAIKPVRPLDILGDDLELEEAISIFNELEEVKLIKQNENGHYVQYSPSLSYGPFNADEALLCRKKVSQRAWNTWIKKRSKLIVHTGRHHSFYLDLFTTEQAKEIRKDLDKIEDKIKKMVGSNSLRNYELEEFELLCIDLISMNPLKG